MSRETPAGGGAVDNQGGNIPGDQGDQGGIVQGGGGQVDQGNDGGGDTGRLRGGGTDETTATSTTATDADAGEASTTKPGSPGTTDRPGNTPGGGNYSQGATQPSFPDRGGFHPPGNYGNHYGNYGNHGGGRDHGSFPPGMSHNFGNEGLLTGTLNGVGRLVSNLLGGNNATNNFGASQNQSTSPFDAATTSRPGRPAEGGQGNTATTSRIIDPNPVRAGGQTTPGDSTGARPAGDNGAGNANGANNASNTNNGGAASSGRGADAATGAEANGRAATTPQGTPTDARNPQSTNGTPQGQQAAQAQQAAASAQLAAQPGQLFVAAAQAAMVQTLLNGLPAGQATALQNAQAQLAAGLPLTPEQKALLQGSLFAQAPATTPQAQTQDKPLPLPPQQQNAVRPETELHNPQQLPADAKRQAETLDRSLAKQTADTPQGRNPAETARGTDPRTAETRMQARTEAEAKTLREGGDKAKTVAQTEAARTSALGDEAKRATLLAAAERGRVGVGESIRHALDWVGQQVRAVGGDAKTDEEGVTAMRVVAGLIIAAVVVGITIAVLYAVRVAFVVA